MSSLSDIQNLIRTEWETDSVRDDVTTILLQQEIGLMSKGKLFAKEAGVFSGSLVVLAMNELAPGVRFETRVVEGEAFEPGQSLVELEGPIGLCLSMERTLLNFLSHLCGVASLTRRFVEAVEGTPAKILATRKTLPGLRWLQLDAVRAGGGYVHRRSLSDGILIKDNHQMRADGAELVRRAKESRSPLHRIEIEVDDFSQLDRVLAAGPDIVMLDNFDFEQLKEAVEKVRGKAEIEVSGGVNLESVGAIASLGVNYISVGRLTHSAVAVDLSLDMEQ